MVTTEQLSLFEGFPSLVKTIAPSRRIRSRVCVMRVLMLGAGVQSSTLVEMAIAGEIERPSLVIFSDTGDEPRAVYHHLETYLMPKMVTAGIAFERVQYSNLAADLTDPGVKFISIPLFAKATDGRISQTRRQCTREYKIAPANGAIKQALLRAGHATSYTNTSRNGKKYPCVRVATGISVETVLGISYDERERAASARESWRANSFPLIDRRMTRHDCMNWLRDHNCRVPAKSSCKRCPYHNDLFWQTLETESPDEFEEVCTYDDWLRTPAGMLKMRRHKGELFIHASGVPLRDRPFAQPRIATISMFTVEAMFGSCSGDGGFSCAS